MNEIEARASATAVAAINMLAARQRCDDEGLRDAFYRLPDSTMSTYLAACHAWVSTVVADGKRGWVAFTPDDEPVDARDMPPSIGLAFQLCSLLSADDVETAAYVLESAVDRGDDLLIADAFKLVLDICAAGAPLVYVVDGSVN